MLLAHAVSSSNLLTIFWGPQWGLYLNLAQFVVLWVCTIVHNETLLCRTAGPFLPFRMLLPFSWLCSLALSLLHFPRYFLCHRFCIDFGALYPLFFPLLCSDVFNNIIIFGRELYPQLYLLLNCPVSFTLVSCKSVNLSVSAEFWLYLLYSLFSLWTGFRTENEHVFQTLQLLWFCVP
jgi:hypothetical protein